MLFQLLITQLFNHFELFVGFGQDLLFFYKFLLLLRPPVQYLLQLELEVHQLNQVMKERLLLNHRQVKNKLLVKKTQLQI